MSDRQLLELAAKAAGIDIYFDEDEDSYRTKASGNRRYWNPLSFDGDALRLAVKLEIDVTHYQHVHIIEAFHAESGTCSVDYKGDPYAAARRAIVLVSAEIGKAMQ